jgi:hypothetical protein
MGEARRVGIATGVAAAGAIALFLLSGALSPVDLLFPGSRGEGAAVLVEDFGPGAVPDRYGYDGQETYVVARDFPDVVAASDHGVVEFRIRRILHPALAWPAPAGDATVLVLVAANVVGVGLASWALADLARRHGRDARLGYAAGLALAFPLVISTTEPLAFGLGLAALALADRGRVVAPVALLAAAALGRETALVMAVAAGLVVARRRSWPSGLAVAVLPLVPAVAWWAWLASRVPATPYDTTELLGIRHIGDLARADVVAAAVIIALMVVAVWRWRDVPILWLTAAGFLAACAFYIADSFRVEAFVRLSAVGIALGVAGLVPRAAARDPVPTG